MAEPTSAAAAAATASGIALAALIPGIDSGALIGGFAGAAVQMMHNRDMSIWRKAVYGLVSWLLGYAGAPEMAAFTGIQEPVITSFAVATVAVTVAVTVIDRIKTFDFATIWKRGG